MQKRISTKERRTKRRGRIIAKIRGTHARPRLAVFRSNRFLSAQVIDDDKGITMFSFIAEGKNRQHAKSLGAKVAQEASKHTIQKVVFDRGGYRYHGSIKDFADAAREGGLKF